MQTLDQAIPHGTPLSQAAVRTLGELDVRAMIRDTFATLERLPAVRQRLRDAIPGFPCDVEREIQAALAPGEAYSQVPGRDPNDPPAAARPKEPMRREGLHVGRNDPCPCGSGRKYKKCCMDRPAPGTSVPPSGEGTPPSRYHFEPGSYGGRGGYMPSIACQREDERGSRVLHFVLVRSAAAHDEEDAASAAASSDLAAAFEGARSDDQVATRLRTAGYSLVTDPRVARD